MASGKNKWVPRIVIEELEDIKDEYRLESDQEAFKELTKHARVGREVKRIATLDVFGRKPTGPLKVKKKTRSVFGEGFL